MLVKPDRTSAWATDGVRERSVTRHKASESKRLFIAVKSSSDQSIYIERERHAARLFSRVVRKKPVAARARYKSSLKNGAKPAELNSLQQSAADANAQSTNVVPAVQDKLTKEARGDLFANIQNVVTGAMTPKEAIASAIALN